MLNRDVILTEYRADPRNFQRGARIYDQTLEKQHRLTRDRLGRVDARWERSTRNILASRTALSGLAGVAGGAAVIQLRRYAEQWRDVERRLQSIGVTGAAAQQSLVDLAIRTRSSVGGTAAAVQRLAKSTGDGIEITTRRVETLQKLLASGGASGSERASVSLQLGQALQSGVLSGDEFRSIRENAPVEFLDALAKAAGVTRAELKKFAEDQKLTSAIVLEALDNLASTADAKFGALAVSGEEAFTVLTAGLVAYAGKVDETLGATAAVNGAIASLGEYMAGVGEGAETMARAIKVIGVVSLATAGSRRLGALGSAIQKTTVALRADVAATRQQLAASRELLAQRRLEKVAADERLRVAQADIRQRALQGNVTKASRLELERATRAHTKAVNALTGAQTRALASTRALTAAQKAAAVTTRAWTATMRVASGVMAFFGGPVGLAITGLTLFVGIMSQLKTPVDRARDSFENLSETIGQLEKVNSDLLTDYDKLEQAQKRLAAATRAGGEAARTAAQDDVNSIQTRIEANEKLRAAKALLAQSELVDARNNLAALRRIEQGGALHQLRLENFREQATSRGAGRAWNTPSFDSIKVPQERVEELTDANYELAAAARAAGKELTAQEQAILDNRDAVLEAEVQVLNFEAAVRILTQAVPALSTNLDEAAKLAEKLAKSAAAAQAGIAGLIAAIPHLREAARVQEALTQAASDRDAALAHANLLPSGEREEAIARANELYALATDEIDGTADAMRDADKAFEAFTDRAHLNSLSAQEQAVARQTREYDALREQLEATGASQERLAEAEAAHRQSLANIDERFATHGGGGGSASSADRDAERNLAAARELLVENGQKALYIEQELNAERERLRELLPALIEMGLSRADAEAVLNAELERTEDRLNRVQTASERAAEAFAKGVLQDIRAAEDLNDALDKISKRLLDLAFDRAFDLLAEQFARIGEGTGQGGGFLGNIFSGLFGGGVEAATGGLVHGPGTSTSDSIPAWLSDGEFVIRAASVTPETLPMLDAINRGAVVPRFAGGGQVGRGASSATAGALVNVTIHNHVSNARIETKPSQDGRGLDVMVHDVVNDGILGGKYSKSLGQKFGLRPNAKGT